VGSLFSNEGELDVKKNNCSSYCRMKGLTLRWGDSLSMLKGFMAYLRVLSLSVEEMEEGRKKSIASINKVSKGNMSPSLFVIKCEVLDNNQLAHIAGASER